MIGTPTEPMWRVQVDCGCAVVVDHDHGDRLVRCGGSDTCRGGIEYVVSAERIESVFHEARRRK